MGIVAKRYGIDLADTRAHAGKEMVNEPQRRIGRLEVSILFPRHYSEEERVLLERTAVSCPVHHSLHSQVVAPVQFIYPT